MPGEFEIIRRFFSRIGAVRDDVMLGVGDDAALIEVPSGCELVVCVDTLVEGVHFPAGAPARSIGHRALAVNLSDIAAMGAMPAWFTLALTMPSADLSWLEEFADGLHRLACRHDVALVGGDTTSGPLTVTVQVLGFVPRGTALRRSGAAPGDAICVSGTFGDAAAGLQSLQGRRAIADPHSSDALRNRFLFPEPRIALGLELRPFASAAIDVSDGLLADLGKLLEASGTGARVDLETLPLSPELSSQMPADAARDLAAGGGDDYELCFTGSPQGLETLMQRPGAGRITRIGTIEPQPGLRCFLQGRALRRNPQGFDHFRR